MDTGEIRVVTFGEFELFGSNGRHISADDMHSAVMTKFLLYLLTHRDHMCSKEELIENLWREGEIENPAGALKNITYRVRTYLKKALGDEEFIVGTRGAYAWNSEIKTALDLEEFESCYNKMMHPGLFPDDRIAWGEKAVNLYTGPFGQNVGDMLWASNLSMYYQTRYLNVVNELIAMYRKADEQEKIVSLANQALGFDTLNEMMYCYLIEALIASKQCQLAEEVYQSATKRIYEGLGVRNPKSLAQVHEKILTMSKGVKANSITDVCNDFEEENVDGAFFCGYPVFREIYRLEARKIARMGNKEYVLLFSVESRRASMGAMMTKADEFMLNKGMHRFEEVLDYSLRVGDVVSRYSDYQYIVLLSACTKEASALVAERILRKFGVSNTNDDLKLTYSLEEVSMENGRLHNRNQELRELREESAS